MVRWMCRFQQQRARRDLAVFYRPSISVILDELKAGDLIQVEYGLKALRDHMAKVISGENNDV